MISTKEVINNLKSLKTIYGLSNDMLDSIDIAIAAMEYQLNHPTSAKKLSTQAIERHIKAIEELLNL